MNRNNKKLNASFTFNKKEGQQDHIKNVKKIDEMKKRIRTPNLKLVDEIISTQIDIAKQEKCKIYKVLYNIREKVIYCISNNKPLPKHNDLLNLVANKYILLLAYKKTRKNKGTMTVAHPLPWSQLKQFSESEQEQIMHLYGLPEGLTWETLEIISSFIKKNKYPWGCSRLIWIDKPGTSNKRPVTIPPYADKIVQEAIRMILEAIYEPVFQNMNCSFGYRASTGVHNAIYEIKQQKNTSSMTSVIGGDIKDAYSSLNHDKFIEVLNERIVDKNFLKFLKNRLKNLVYDSKIKKYSINTTGILQGGVDSPYLWNIYLLGMDEFIKNDIQTYLTEINDKRLRSKRNNKRLKTQPMNPLYNETKKNRDIKRKELQSIVKFRLGKELYFNKIKEIRLLSHQLRQLNYYDPQRKTLRLLYVRYADDFVIITNAPKNVNLKIKSDLANWLKSERDLTLLDEKSKIIDIRKEPAKFLGFELINKPTRKVARDSRGNLKRTTGWQMTIAPDRVRLLNRLFRKGYCRKNGFPKEISVLSKIDAYTLIQKTNAVLEGLANYYMGYITYSHSLTRWLYIIRWSCMKTLAQKHHTKVRGVLKKYPNLTATVEVKVKNRAFQKKMKLFTETEIKRKALSNTNYYFVMFAQEKIRKGEFMFYSNTNSKGTKRTPRIMDNNFIENINWTAARTAARLDLPCLICGYSKAEMHHVKHVRKSNWSKINPNNFIEQLQYIRNRKQVPVCKKCHLEIHKGNYDKRKLSSIINSRISDTRISAIEGYIINFDDPSKGLPLIDDLLNKGWEELT